LWDLHLQKRIRSVPTLPPSLLLRAFEVSADLSIAIAVAGGSHDTLSAWDLRSGEELWHKDFKHTLHVNLSPDSKQVLAVVMPDHLGIGAPEELVLFNALAGKVESSVPFPDAKAAVASLQFAADGKAVVLGVATPGRFGSTTGTAQIWSLPDLKPIAPGLRQEGWIYRLAFGKNGTRLLTSTKEGEVRLWDAAPLLDDLHLRQRQDATAK